LSSAVAHTLEGWTPVCGDVPFLDCYGVAALFANNLARNWQWVQAQSGGVVTVRPRPACPDFGDISGGMQDPSFCWQATASVDGGHVCMVIARQIQPAMGFEFGQVGGDEMAGLAVPPGYKPKNPCI
jgi:hypothetical protein